jgi:hypothetical protein
MKIYNLLLLSGHSSPVPLISAIRRTADWDGKQTREWTEDCGQKKTLRVAQNVILCEITDGKIEIKGVKVLEQGKRFFQNVSKRDKKYVIRDWIFEIERSGNKMD